MKKIKIGNQTWDKINPLHCRLSLGKSVTNMTDEMCIFLSIKLRSSLDKTLNRDISCELFGKIKMQEISNKGVT